MTGCSVELPPTLVDAPGLSWFDRLAIVCFASMPCQSHNHHTRKTKGQTRRAAPACARQDLIAKQTPRHSICEVACTCAKRMATMGITTGSEAERGCSVLGRRSNAAAAYKAIVSAQSAIHQAATEVGLTPWYSGKGQDVPWSMCSRTRLAAWSNSMSSPSEVSAVFAPTATGPGGGGGGGVADDMKSNRSSLAGGAGAIGEACGRGPGDWSDEDDDLRPRSSKL